MMQTLRKKTRLVLFIALAGFALLIFFQWGLDITNIRGKQETDIAKIDGVVIPYSDYLRYAQMKYSENRNIEGDEIWSMIIEEVMWRNLIQKERMRVTDEEIWAIIRNNPPREIYESEYLKDEKGEFDWNKYFELLRAPQSYQWLIQYEYRLREELPKEKLRSLLSTLGWVSPFEESLAIAAQTVQYDLSVLSIPIFRIRNRLSISEDELIEYYNSNLDEFIKPMHKILKYVFFERKPSSYDTSEARERLEDFIASINEGEDFIELAREVADDTTIEYSFENENMLKPYQLSVYKNLRDGEISGILNAARGFEVIKKVRKGLIYVVKAEVRVSPSTISDIYDQIVNFKETVQEIGFDSAAAELNIATRKTYPLNTENVSFPVRNIDGLKKFLSGVKEGEIGGPFGSLGGYYLFVLDSIIPKSTPKFEEIKTQIKAGLEKERLQLELDNYLTQIRDRLMAGEKIETVAHSDSATILYSSLKNQSLTRLQGTYGPEFAGTIATLQANQISQPLLTEWTGYLIRCDAKETVPFDSSMVFMLTWKRQQRLQQLTQEIFTPKKIEDNRDNFFEW